MDTSLHQLTCEACVRDEGENDDDKERTCGTSEQDGSLDNEPICRPDEEPLGSASRLPFLMRFPVSAFGVTMGVSSQAMVWRGLVIEPTYNSEESKHATGPFQLSLLQFGEHTSLSVGIASAIGGFWWCAGLITLLCTCLVFALKLLFYQQEVRLELKHAVRSNFFAGPFLASLFLLMGTPAFVRPNFVVHLAEALALTIPLVLLEVYLYGHWMMMGKKRRLSEVANPTTQIAVVGNFVGASAFGLADSKDLALFMFSFGTIHQLVVFTTAYAKLSSVGMSSNPKLYPYLFLFVAPPCASSLAWKDMQGNNYDDVFKILFFSGLSIYIILVSRAFTMMKGVRFSLEWWAYTFPSGAAAMGMIAYANSIHGLSLERWLVIAMALVMVGVSNLVLVGVSIATIYTACFGNLFGNGLVLSQHLLHEV